jgi:predicted nicotinamide N-methyase
MEDRSEVKVTQPAEQFKLKEIEIGKNKFFIREVLNGPFGLFVWPSSIVLACFVDYYGHIFANKHVIELGAGTGLCGLVAARAGAIEVTLTDLPEPAMILENTAECIKLNKLCGNCSVVRAWKCKLLLRGSFISLLLSTDGASLG